MLAVRPAARRAFEVPAVGPDRQPGHDLAPVSEPRTDRVGGKFVCLDPRRSALEAGNLRDLGRERLGHKVVLNIPPEGVETNLGRVEFHRPRRKERSRVVDEAQRAQRRGSGLQVRPQAKGLEKCGGLVEQGDGASMPRSLGRAAADDVEPGLGHAERRSQPGKPRARDQDIRAVHGRLIAGVHPRSPHYALAPLTALLCDWGDGGVQL